MTTTPLRRRRLRALVATTAIACAVAPASADAALSSEEQAVVDAVRNVLIENAKQKQLAVSNGIEMPTAAADGVASPTTVRPGVPMEARLRHPQQGGEALKGSAFLDETAAVGALPIDFTVTFTARASRTSTTSLGVDKARLTKIDVGSDGTVEKVSTLFAPQSYAKNAAAPAPLSRSLQANVRMAVDPPALQVTAGQVAAAHNRPAPANAEELIALVDEFLSPDTTTRAIGDDLCTATNSCPPDEDGELFNAIKGIDLGPGDTLVSDLLEKLITVQPLAVPTISMWSRHDTFATAESGARHCSDGFLLIAVPGGTVSSTSKEAVNSAVDTLSATLGKLNTFSRFARMATGLGQLNTIVDSFLSTPSKAATVKVVAGSARDLDSFEMVGDGLCSWYNDIEAEDEISSALVFGLPGAKWRGYKHGNFEGTTYDLNPSITFLSRDDDLPDGLEDELSSLAPIATPSPLSP